MSIWDYREIQEHRAAFLAALRPGDFTQGYGNLTSILDGIEQDCCLGVACKVSMRDNGVTREAYAPLLDGSPFKYGKIGSGFDWSTGVLPAEVCDWLGINESNPTLVPQHRPPSGEVKEDEGRFYSIDATEANDDLKLTFDQIADLFQFYFARVGVIR